MHYALYENGKRIDGVAHETETGANMRAAILSRKGRTIEVKMFGRV